MTGDKGNACVFFESALEHPSWLALMIGNSRLHWAWFVDTRLKHTWNTDYLPVETVEEIIQHWASGVMPSEILPPSLIASPSNPPQQLPLYLASVVPTQTKLWQAYPTAVVITLEQLPLQGLYPTLGIDRALALLGAGETLGYPVLVIDAGTALTFTGADAHKQLIGGAILPGVRLQFQSLAQGTAALPAVQLPTQLPPRWAKQTSSAIESGIIYTVLASIQNFIADWQCQFPESHIVLTGGDSAVLLTYLQHQFPQLATQLIFDPDIIFAGIKTMRQLAS